MRPFTSITVFVLAMVAVDPNVMVPVTASDLPLDAVPSDKLLTLAHEDPFQYATAAVAAVVFAVET